MPRYEINIGASYWTEVVAYDEQEAIERANEDFADRAKPKIWSIARIDVDQDD